MNDQANNTNPNNNTIHKENNNLNEAGISTSFNYTN